MTPVERCKARIDHVGVTTGCWIVKATSYPTLGIGGLQVRMSRIMLADKLGHPIKNFALHTCDVKQCINPDHLYDGTRSQNGKDAVARGQKTVLFSNGNSPTQKLTENDVRAIRAVKRRKHLHAELAAQYGVHPSYINQLRCGAHWASILCN